MDPGARSAGPPARGGELVRSRLAAQLLRAAWVAGCLPGAALLVLAPASPAAAQGARQPIRYLLLPQNEPPSAERPSLARIRRFLAEHPAVENTAEGLDRNLEFARAVLGQQQIFADAAAFQAAHPAYQVRIHFIAPAEWFARLQAE